VNCPACGGSSKVNTTRLVVGTDGDRCRWRVCDDCGLRWYSWQAAEQLLPSHAVRWLQSDVFIDADVLRRLRKAAFDRS
jgi:transcriptional regulator NrdR family protein